MSNDTLFEEGWEDFQGKKQLSEKKNPTLTIQKQGSFGLNQRAYEMLGSPERVVFRYNKNRKAIALRGAKEGELHSYPVQKQQSSSYVVSSKAFLQYVDYPYLGVMRAYIPKSEGDMLVIEIEDGEGGDNNGSNKK